MSIRLVETCQLAWQPDKPEKARKDEKKFVVLLMKPWGEANINSRQSDLKEFSGDLAR